MENPGSFNQAKENHPDLPEMEVRKLWEGELLTFQKFVRSQIQVEPVDEQ